MKKGSFIMDGIDSDTIKTLIQTRPLIEAPSRKVEWRSTYGVDGTVPFDEGAYNDTNLELVLFVDGDDMISDRQNVYDLFDTKGSYKEFIPYFDPDKIYRVMLDGSMSFDNNYMYGQKQSATAKFRVKPYKYLIANSPVILGVNGGTITNPTKYTSQPIIRITGGTGPVLLTINGIPFSIKNLPNVITLNSEQYVAYQEDANGILISMNNQIGTREYPLFKPGVNTISVTGSVTELYIEPRWRSLV